MRAALVAAMLLASGVAGAQDLSCEECVEQQPAPPKRSSLLLQVDVGPEYTYALGRSFGGARVDLAVGREFANGLTLDGRFGFEAGGSESGLPYQRVSWGAGLGGRLAPRVRLAIGPRIGVTTIVRATNPEPLHDLVGFTFGAHGEIVVALTGPGPRAERARAGGLDLIVRVGYDGWLMDYDENVAHTVTCKLALGGHF